MRARGILTLPSVDLAMLALAMPVVRAKMLFVAILVLGLASVPRVAVGVMRMRRYHLVA